MATGLDAINALSRLEQGELLQKLYDALTETADEVLRASSKNQEKVTKGKVTLTLDIEHDRTWDDLQIVVLGQITKGLPKTQPQGATFWQFEGFFHRDNPRSDPLPGFHEVPHASGSRDIDPPAATSREIAQ